MDRLERQNRRDVFLGQADDYFAARPEYPDELLLSAVELGDLQPGQAVLDVGCGTGQASNWFAERGFRVTAIDRSEEMVRLAKRRLQSHSNVEVRCQDFEEATGLEDFAALVFATSYHWLDPDSRAERCARVLRSTGALILLWHTHPMPYSGYFERSQTIYKRHVPGWAPQSTPGRTEDDLQRIVGELESAGYFGRIERRSKDWTRTYDRALYLRLLNTYSDHRLLPDVTRNELFSELGSLITTEFGGLVERPYRTEMIVAKRS